MSRKGVTVFKSEKDRMNFLRNKGEEYKPKKIGDKTDAVKKVAKKADKKTDAVKKEVSE